MDAAVILWQLDSEQGKVLWNATLDDLLAQGCHWLQGYFKTNLVVKKREGSLCSDMPPDWIAEGEELAREGNIPEAIVKFQKARLQNSELDLQPEAKARSVAAQARLKLGKTLIRQGKIKQAITIYAEVNKLDPSLNVSDRDWNRLCWDGSLYGYSKEVITACDKAVELDSTKGQLLDSRALAKSLSGNRKGAIEDFQKFLKWVESELSQNQTELKKYEVGLILDEEFQKDKNEDIKKYKDLISYKNTLIYWRDSRQSWIKALEVGKNPFTPELLDYLHIEHLNIKKPTLTLN